MVCLAVDLLGGDHGSSPFLRGSILALEQNSQLQLILMADKASEAECQHILEKYQSRVSLSLAENVVKMEDSAVSALRKKADSTMAQAIRLHKDGKVDAVVSAGNTAVLVGFGIHILGLIDGVSRPAICTSIPTSSGKTWMLDIGAILQLSSDRLCELAALGSALCRSYDGKQLPKVGLLNVGSEESKGTDELKAASEVMAEAENYQFVGYVEGDQLFNGQQDLVICDGFSGNIAIKTAQGLSRFLKMELHQVLKSNFFTRAVVRLLKTTLKKFANRIDPSLYNGAPLLGLNGLVVKSHGSADEYGFAHAIVVAAEMAERGLVESISEEIFDRDLPESTLTRFLKKVNFKKQVS